MSHHSSPHSPPSYPISEISLPADTDEDADAVGNDNDDDDNDEGVNSLPDSGTSDDIDDIDESDAEGESDAEREWKESLQQLELLLTMVVVPYVGKYFGRKCAYWSEFFFRLHGVFGQSGDCRLTRRGWG